MRYVAAYLLGSLTGKEPSSADVENILSSVGIEIDSAKLEKVVSVLKGKNLEELTSKGLGKLALMSVGGGVTTATSAAPAAVAEASAPESKKEAKKKEESESEDDDMGFGLFD